MFAALATASFWRTTMEKLGWPEGRVASVPPWTSINSVPLLRLAAHVVYWAAVARAGFPGYVRYTVLDAVVSIQAVPSASEDGESGGRAVSTERRDKESKHPGP